MSASFGRDSRALETTRKCLDLAPCWQLVGCDAFFCPAHQNWEQPCWRQLGTHCGRHHPSAGAGKLEACLICPVIKLHADTDERGWNHFLAEEMIHLTGREHTPAPPFAASLHQVLHHLPYGVVIADEKEDIQFLNAVAEKITGLSSHEAMGMSAREMFHKANLMAGFTIQNDTPDGETLIGKEYEWNRLDGGVVFCSCLAAPLRNEQGSTIARMYVLEDISDRKRLEKNLQRSENKYRSLFEGSKDMIFIHSRGSIFKDVNQAGVEMLGYGSKEELLSLTSVERIYINPIHRKVFQEQIDRNGFVKDFETSFRKKDGARVHCLISGHAIRDADGKVVGYQAIAKDITARMDGVRNLQQQHRELSLLHSVAVAMNVTHELGEILMIALKRVLDVLNLNCGGVFLIDREKSAFVLKVQQGLPEPAVGKACQTLLRDEALMRFLLSDDRSLKPQHTFPPLKATLKPTDDGDFLELTCFLITTKDKATGFLALQVPPNRQITDHDHHMLGCLGNFLGSAIENACLLQTIHQHREELQSLTAKLFHSQEEERKRIARELHDEAGQALTGINFTLETIEKNLAPDFAHIQEKILEVKKQINRTYQEMRRISHRLHPALLSDLGLEPALENCLSRISKYSQLEIDFRMVGFEERLHPEIETVLYRISQEALNNTLKHSGAKRFKLSIIKSYPNIIFLAEDDGAGFDPNHFEKDQRGLGLLGMRERASTVGGIFSLRTAKGKGTRIRIEIPIKESFFE